MRRMGETLLDPWSVPRHKPQHVSSPSIVLDVACSKRDFRTSHTAPRPTQAAPLVLDERSRVRVCFANWKSLSTRTLLPALLLYRDPAREEVQPSVSTALDALKHTGKGNTVQCHQVKAFATIQRSQILHIVWIQRFKSQTPLAPVTAHWTHLKDKARFKTKTLCHPAHRMNTKNKQASTILQRSCATKSRQ